jgi:2'-5' RNA ligase
MPRSLLAIAYPNISPADLEWMQSLRQKHDALYMDIVEPHFTLVFPVFDIDEAKFVAHIEQQVREIEAFEFVIRCAVLGDDAFSDYTHVFLAPDEGYSNVVKLHDRLYTGLLTGELRLDIPFVPHIGVANSPDAKACKKLVDELNSKDFAIAGKIEIIDAIWYEDDKVGTIERILLK